MYAQRTHHVDHELLKWFILIVLTLLIVLFTTRSSGAEPVEPTLVAAAAVEGSAALPIREAIPKQAKPKIEYPSQERLPRRIPTARRLWEIFELHETRDFEKAINRWQELSLFDSDESWRAIAVGQAYLQLGDLDDALCMLHEGPSPANAVTYHLRGVAQWLNARVAVREGKLYLAEELRDDARGDFEKAIALSTQLKLDEKLGLVMSKFVAVQRIGPHDAIFPELLLSPRNPRASDLLSVLNLENFVARSHLGLAEIGLEEGYLEEVEDHLDDAAELGSDVAELYAMLGGAYEADGESASAARAYMKAMTGKQKVVPAIKALRNLRKATPLD